MYAMRSYYEATAYHLARNGEIFGKIYMDLEARDDKQGGAWMGDWRTHAKTPDRNNFV